MHEHIENTVEKNVWPAEVKQVLKLIKQFTSVVP